jgi:hypothetical protein
VSGEELRARAGALLDAIEAKDEANIHGWSVALRAALAAPSTPEPSAGSVSPACGLSWWTVGDDGYDCNHAPSTPEPSGLLEAWHRYVEGFTDPDSPQRNPSAFPTRDAFAAGWDAALAALSTEPALDVERLADLFMDLRLDGPSGDGWTYQETARHYATIILARLAESQS